MKYMFIHLYLGSRLCVSVIVLSCVMPAPKKTNDTCAWTPNKVFIQCVLVSVETARVLLQSLWARLSTGASREAPVDNECLGKSRQVGDDGKS